MAIVTGFATRKVSCMLARCRHSIMAGEARADNLRMVYGIDRGPAHVVMAVFAYIAGRYVRRAFAFCAHAVMATETAVCDTGMVKRRG